MADIDIALWIGWGIIGWCWPPRPWPWPWPWPFPWPPPPPPPWDVPYWRHVLTGGVVGVIGGLIGGLVFSRMFTADLGSAGVVLTFFGAIAGAQILNDVVGAVVRGISTSPGVDRSRTRE